ncbi:S1 family peptidase [Nocardioides houyundeii]|uniref:S1 family peptidase n=1 Tax=Nocardioides houyundeii TaxID=2045452 RepID=UPI000DF467FB|nr:trypsin-like serine protease [Nocardioides houyundeii]
MNRHLLRAAAVAVGGLLLSPMLPASAIVGGAPDAGEHPFVGQVFFYVPDAVDSRFDDPGGWFNCTGTLIDPDTVVTAGHCTYAVGVEGEVPADPLSGSTDVWFSVAEAPDYSVFPPSSTFVPDRNEERYETWSALLDASPQWSEAQSTFTHPDYVDEEFLQHDLGVVELSEPIVLPEYGTLPTPRYLDRYAGGAKNRALFESVGYGLEGSGPKSSFGGDTRRKADRRLVSLRGAYGLRDTAVMFSHAGRGTTGGTCFGDSGGPTFDITTPAIAEQNIIVAVTSFGQNYNCNASGSYRIDQPDDLAFIADPAGSY